MPRSTNNVATKRRHKKILKMAKGYYLGRKNLYRTACEAVEKGLTYAYRDRRTKKREFRKLWIMRINAAARLNGISYNNLISGLKKAEISIDRKMLANLAVTDMDAFAKLVETAKQHLEV